MKLLVTGANGFVGRAVCRLALARHLNVCAAVRQLQDLPVAQVAVGAIDSQTNWRGALEGRDTVIHLAALAHRPLGNDAQAHSMLRATNVDGALELARQAADAGVRRFVFLSSIKAWGEATKPGQAARECDICEPQDDYGRSKLAAEEALREFSSQGALELVIVRAPLVYGPGAKANLAALAHAVRKGWPLPLGSVRNARSLVALDSLCDFLLLCATHPVAADQTFHVSDGTDLSSAELVRALAQGAGLPARLWPVPPAILRLAARVLGREEAVRRLLDSLQVDISKAQHLLGWQPPLSVAEGMRRIQTGGSAS